MVVLRRRIRTAGPMRGVGRKSTHHLWANARKLADYERTVNARVRSVLHAPRLWWHVRAADRLTVIQARLSRAVPCGAVRCVIASSNIRRQMAPCWWRLQLWRQSRLRGEPVEAVPRSWERSMNSVHLAEMVLAEVEHQR